MTEASSKIAKLTHSEELRYDRTPLQCGSSSHRREEQEILDVMRIQVFAISAESSNLNNEAYKYTGTYIRMRPKKTLSCYLDSYPDKVRLHGYHLRSHPDEVDNTRLLP
jgi:hypothetical protein